MRSAQEFVYRHLGLKPSRHTNLCIKRLELYQKYLNGEKIPVWDADMPLLPKGAKKRPLKWE